MEQSVDFVARSSVRHGVVEAAADGPVSTADLIAGVDGSESSVYAALTELADANVLVETDDGWVATGMGQAIASQLAERAAVQQLLRNHEEYWASHDLSVLPPRFRQTIGVLSNATIYRATEADPGRVIRRVRQAMAAAEHLKVLSPVFHEDYVEAVGQTDTARIVVDWSVGDADPPADEGDVPPGTEIRLGGIDVALAVTESELLLSFPSLNGTYDAQTELIAETQAARDWGSRLFRSRWTDAEAVPSQ
ncbi:MAG: helix-turn-helix transcriptional regulator [Halobacteriaceae archaeon]